MCSSFPLAAETVRLLQYKSVKRRASVLENCLDRPLNSPNTQTPTCLLSMTQMPPLWSKGQSSHDFLISRVTLLTHKNRECNKKRILMCSLSCCGVGLETGHIQCWMRATKELFEKFKNFWVKEISAKLLERASHVVVSRHWERQYENLPWNWGSKILQSCGRLVHSCDLCAPCKGPFAAGSAPTTRGSAERVEADIMDSFSCFRLETPFCTYRVMCWWRALTEQ